MRKLNSLYKDVKRVPRGGGVPESKCCDCKGVSCVRCCSTSYCLLHAHTLHLHHRAHWKITSRKEYDKAEAGVRKLREQVIRDLQADLDKLASLPVSKLPRPVEARKTVPKKKKSPASAVVSSPKKRRTELTIAEVNRRSAALARRTPGVHGPGAMKSPAQRLWVRQDSLKRPTLPRKSATEPPRPPSTSTQSGPTYTLGSSGDVAAPAESKHNGGLTRSATESTIVVRDWEHELAPVVQLPPMPDGSDTRETMAWLLMEALHKGHDTRKPIVSTRDELTSDAAVPLTTSDALYALARQIERTLVDKYPDAAKPGGANEDYVKHARMLIFNLGSKNNEELRNKVIHGELPPAKLLSLESHELASTLKQLERKAAIDEASAPIKDDWVDETRFTCETCGSSDMRSLLISQRNDVGKAEIWGDKDNQGQVVRKVFCKACEVERTIDE